MDTKLSLTKELSELRTKAAELEKKIGEEFKKVMLEINSVKVKLIALVGKEETDASSK